ncbi:MAG TPA: TlpA disulfide reductase family protein [bacterium]
MKRPDLFDHPLVKPFSRREAVALLAAAAATMVLPRGLRAATDPLLLDTPKTPVQALDFMGINAAGKPVRLSDLKGNVVLLNFWATWCVPCLEEMPSMDRLNRQLQGKKFKVLAVDLQETADQVQQFAKNNKFSYDLVLDPAGEISHHYGVLRIPVNYVVDQKGLIIRRALGSRVWDSKESIAFFTGLISAPPTAQTGDPEPAAYLTQPKGRKR